VVYGSLFGLVLRAKLAGGVALNAENEFPNPGLVDMIGYALLDIGTTTEWNMPTSPKLPLPVNQRGLLSADDAAEYLSISVRTFGKLASDGVIKRRRIGSLVRYALSDLDAYIDSLPNEAGRCPRLD
jgi:excisionase family DNA binding protein